MAQKPKSVIKPAPVIQQTPAPMKRASKPTVKPTPPPVSKPAPKQISKPSPKLPAKQVITPPKSPVKKPRQTPKPQVAELLWWGVVVEYTSKLLLWILVSAVIVGIASSIMTLAD